MIEKGEMERHCEERVVTKLSPNHHSDGKLQPWYLGRIRTCYGRQIDAILDNRLGPNHGNLDIEI